MKSLNFLNSKNYRQYNVQLAKETSIHAAIFLCEMIYQFDKFTDKEEEDKKSYLKHKDGMIWIYLTHDDVEDRTAMSRDEQDTAIKKLIAKGLIKKIISGVPGKRYFTILEENVLALFGLSKNVCQIVGFPQTRLRDSHKLECGIPTNSPIYKTPDIKEPDNRREGPPPDSFFYFGKVKMPQKDYDSLVKEHGQTKTDQYVNRLDEYSRIKPKAFREYGCHFSVIKSWIRMDVEKKSNPLFQKPTNKFLDIPTTKDEWKPTYANKNPSGEK